MQIDNGDRLLGEKIKKIRENARITQLEFAKSLGIAQGILELIETGQMSPDYKTIIALKQKYKINLDKLLVQ